MFPGSQTIDNFYVSNVAHEYTLAVVESDSVLKIPNLRHFCT